MSRAGPKSPFASRPSTADAWVRAPEARPAPAPAYTARLTIDVTPSLRGRRFVITSTNPQRVREVAGEEHVLEIVGKPHDLEAIVTTVESATRGQDTRLPPGATQV